MDIEQQYLSVLERLTKGQLQENRTGTDAYKIPPVMLQHDMADGYPAVTTKNLAFETLKVEGQGFIGGITSKKWFQDRGCHIWDEWCCPSRVPYGNDPETLQKMKEEDYLGACIYGASWRNFHDPRVGQESFDFGEANPFNIPTGEGSNGVDQFKNIVDKLKENPQDRRMICMAWNPMGINHTALPPCHVLFQVTTRGNKLDLTWYQRSNDWFLGVPFNLGSYALILHLLAKESGMEEGILTGFLADVHLYENHMDQAKEQLSRTPRQLPTIKTDGFTSIFDWDYTQTSLVGYDPHKSIKAPVAV